MNAEPRHFKRAAVIVPPIQDFYFTQHRFSALGAQIVANLLARSGLQAEVYNFPLMNPRGTAKELPEPLAYLRPLLIDGETGRLSFFTTFRHFGPPVEQCVQMIESFKPDMCFLSVFAFCYADGAIELSEAIRKKNASIRIVVGGGGACAYPHYFLKRASVDFVLTGEAEASLNRFMKELEAPFPDFAKVPNLMWKEAGAIRASPLVSVPSEEEIEVCLVKSAETSRRITFSTSLSRGCPKQCSFCSSHLVFGKSFRTAPAERINDALLHLSIDHTALKKQIVINFEDDNLLADESFLKSVIASFQKHIPGVEFIAENGIDYSFITPELCDWLIENGMRKFNLSLASLDPEILSKRRRFLHLERFEKIQERLSQKGIPNVTYFICGFKEDSIGTVANNLLYLANKETLIGISMYYPVPGLPGNCDLSAFDHLPSLLCLGSVAFPWNNSLSTETMITAFRLSRYINLLKNSHRSEKENQLLAIIADKKELHTLVREKSGAERLIPVQKQDKELVNLVLSGMRMV